MKESKVPHPESSFLVGKEASDVSSTQVRSILSEMHAATSQKEKLKSLKKLSDRRMSTPEMNQYLLDNE